MGSLRPALEDYLGAGAVIAGLAGTRSAEAHVAAAAASGGDDLPRLIRSSVSRAEPQARGWTADLDYACQRDVSAAVPIAPLVDGAFTNASARGTESASVVRPVLP